MKKFNQTIKIEVPVDSIAAKLLENMNPEFKHAELVVEAAIATALEHNTVHFIYNALNGYPPEINFKVGDKVLCTTNLYMYDGTQSKSVYMEMGKARITEINPYSSAQLKVVYTHQGKDESTQEETWVSMNSCSYIPKLESKVAIPQKA